MMATAPKQLFHELRATLCVVIAGMSVNACDCTGGSVSDLAPDLVVESDRVVFDDNVVGIEQSQRFVVENIGAVDALVSHVVTGEGFSVDGQAGIVPPGGRVTLRLAHFPVRSGTFAGVLTLRASEGLRLSSTAFDDRRQEFRVELVASADQTPVCDDDNECTDDSFDLERGACRSTPHTRECGADNACIVDGQCGEGACLGTPLVCNAVSPCRVAVCDRTLGCIEEDIAGACDDDDPCTADICTEEGCTHEGAEDFTACGPTITCVSAQVCQSGICTMLPLPDGITCDDGVTCTDAVCTQGVCVGTPSTTNTEDPAVIQRLRFPGGKGSSAFGFNGNEMLTFDPPTLSHRTSTGTARLYRAVGDGDPQMVFEQEFSGQEVPVEHVIGGRLSHWIGLAVASSFTHVMPFPPEDDTAPVALSVPALHVAFIGNTAIVCDYFGDLGVIDLDADPTTYVGSIPRRPGFICLGLAIDEASGAVAIHYGDDVLGEVRVFNLSNPAVPEEVFRSSAPGSGYIAAEAGRVVVVGPNGDLHDEVSSFSFTDLEANAQFSGPDNHTVAGPHALIGGFIYMRWADSIDDENARLYRRQADGDGGWDAVPGTGTRPVSAPAPQWGAKMMAFPAKGEVGTLLLNFNHGTRPAFARAPVNHGRHGALITTTGMTVSVAPGLVRQIELELDDDGEVRVAGVETIDEIPATEQAIEFIAGPYRYWIDPIRLTNPFVTSDVVFGDTLTKVILEPAPVPQLTVFEAAFTGPDTTTQLVSAASTNTHVALAIARQNLDTRLMLEIQTVIANGATGAYSWVPTDIDVLVDPVNSTSVPLAVNMNGTRVAVLAAGLQTVVLSEIDGSGMNSVLASHDYSGDIQPINPFRVAVSGDEVLLLGWNTMRLLRRNGAALEVVSTGVVDAGRVLNFNGATVVVAGLTTLDYISLENGPALLHSVELGEQPIGFQEIGNRILVTTDHGVAVINATCPAP